MVCDLKKNLKVIRWLVYLLYKRGKSQRLAGKYGDRYLFIYKMEICVSLLINSWMNIFQFYLTTSKATPIQSQFQLKKKGGRVVFKVELSVYR
jgi:hypothetical protein